MQVPLTIWSYKNFTEKDYEERIALGLYYGIILVMLLYNLFLFFSLRDRNYLYYVLYIANYGFMQISLGGLVYEYLWPGLPWWSNRAIPFFIAFSILWVSKFSSSFLLAKVHTPRINKLFHILIGLSGLVMIWSLVGNYTAATVVAGGLTMGFYPGSDERRFDKLAKRLSSCQVFRDRLVNTHVGNFSVHLKSIRPTA